MGRRVVVTGGRDFEDDGLVWRTLNALLAGEGISCVINGGARGADSLCAHWAKVHGVPCITVPAPWDFYGKGAGQVRNQWMIDLCYPDLCMAYPGGNGTAHMIGACRKAQIEVRKNV